MSQDRLRIPLSDRRAIEIAREDWPVIAEATHYADDGSRRIIVRQGPDGRRVAYGEYRSDQAPRASPSQREIIGGFLLEAGAHEDETIRAIRRVGGLQCNQRLADDCIMSLPSEVLS